MKYMLLLYGEADAGPAPGTPEFGQMLEAYMTSTEAMRTAGVLLDSSPLRPVQPRRPSRSATANSLSDRWNYGPPVPDHRRRAPDQRPRE